MKKVRLLIPILLVVNLIAAFIPAVGAIDENQTITDSLGDVIDLNKEDIVEDHPDIEVKDIDIKRLTYFRSDKSVEITLEVDGNIGDRGTEDDFIWFGFDSGILDDESDFDFNNLNLDTIAYTFILLTSDDEYSILYINQSCRLINSSYEAINISKNDFSVNGDTLTINIELGTTDETYESISVQAQYMKLKIDFSDLDQIDDENIQDLEDMMTILTDEAPNQPLQAFSQVTNLGEVGKSVAFEGFGIYGQPPYEYEWDFGDGDSSSDKNTTHVYESAGNFTYKLTITDASGESQTDSGIIEIISTQDDNGTPGFELLLIIVAIGIIALWKRKK
jgi:hypothetical protein